MQRRAVQSGERLCQAVLPGPLAAGRGQTARPPRQHAPGPGAAPGRAASFPHLRWPAFCHAPRSLTKAGLPGPGRPTEQNKALLLPHAAEALAALPACAGLSAAMRLQFIGCLRPDAQDAWSPGRTQAAGMCRHTRWTAACSLCPCAQPCRARPAQRTGSPAAPGTRPPTPRAAEAG